MTAADARETARAWMARQICDSFDAQPSDAHRPSPLSPLFAGTTHLPPPEPPCPGCYAAADAILSADGVEVEEEAMVYHPGWTSRAGTFGMPATHTQVVIRLPAQPSGETT